MHRLSLTPVAHAMALLAFFATCMPATSACCCCNSMVESKSTVCCAKAAARTTCCQAKSQAVCERCKGKQRCSCSTISGRQCNSRCRCVMRDLVNKEWSVAPTSDVSQVGRHFQDCWSGVLHIPLTVANYAIDFSLKPDVILSHERLSAQILLGVRIN